MEAWCLNVNWTTREFLDSIFLNASLYIYTSTTGPSHHYFSPDHMHSSPNWFPCLHSTPGQSILNQEEPGSLTFYLKLSVLSTALR